MSDAWVNDAIGNQIDPLGHSSLARSSRSAANVNTIGDGFDEVGTAALISRSAVDRFDIP